ncbi:MAG: hypothetical protein HC867_03060 [Bacteroidia bacterium]|nr:hypothetical protein [Bacteroidia bacterium]
MILHNGVYHMFYQKTAMDLFLPTQNMGRPYQYQPGDLAR